MKRITGITISAVLVAGALIAAQSFTTLDNKAYNHPTKMKQAMRAIDANFAQLEDGDDVSLGAVTVNNAVTAVSTNDATTNVIVTTDGEIDGEYIADDTIDDDSIDLSTGAGLSLSDMPNEDVGDVSVAGGVYTVEAATFTSEPQISANIGTADGSVATEYAGQMRVTSLALNETVTLADGDDGEEALIYTFPEGRILILGAAIDGVVTNGTNFNADANDVFSVSIGTTGAVDANATLTGTEADIIASTELDTDSGGTTTNDWEADMTSGADTVFDGTSTPVKLYANASVAAASNSGANGIGFSGFLRVAWVLLGND